MIQANELRIGNLVYDDFKEAHRVESIQSDTFTKYNNVGDTNIVFSKIDGTGGFYQCDEVTPIPLTEEWLCKTLASCHNGVFIIWHGLVPIKIWKGSDNIWYSSVGEIYLEKRIKYVHQLQNLYFALTGEELKINII